MMYLFSARDRKGSLMLRGGKKKNANINRGIEYQARYKKLGEKKGQNRLQSTGKWTE